MWFGFGLETGAKVNLIKVMLQAADIVRLRIYAHRLATLAIFALVLAICGQYGCASTYLLFA